MTKTGYLRFCASSFRLSCFSSACGTGTAGVEAGIRTLLVVPIRSAKSASVTLRIGFSEAELWDLSLASVIESNVTGLLLMIRLIYFRYIEGAAEVAADPELQSELN